MMLMTDTERIVSAAGYYASQDDDPTIGAFALEKGDTDYFWYLPESYDHVELDEEE